MMPLREAKNAGWNEKGRMLALWSAAMIVAACCLSGARADTITFAGTSIAMRDCKIESVKGGQVSFTDSLGQRQKRPLDDIESLGFDGLPELDKAEQAIADNDLDSGLSSLLRALLKARGDLQRQWVHSRLAHVHDARSEYVQAAGHAAATMELGDDPSWRRLEPVSPVNDPSYAAAREALDHLQSAAKKVQSAELKASLARMTKKVQPVCDRLAKSYAGKPIAPGSTVSGLLKDDILADAALSAGKPLSKTSSKPSEPQDNPAREKIDSPANGGRAKGPSPAEQNSPLARIEDPDSPGAIDRMLSEKRWQEALSACRRIEREPGQRDLAHFLYQYGSALAGDGQKKDAAVMFTRCAVLFVESSDGVHSLIQTAIIYRDEYHQPATATRLLQRAVEQANSRGDGSAAMLARELLAQ